MIIDKYTKFILTLIAVGILGLNFYLFKGDIVKEAKAEVNIIDLDIFSDQLMQRIALSEVKIISRINEVNIQQEKNVGLSTLILAGIGNELGVSKTKIQEIFEGAEKIIKQ